MLKLKEEIKERGEDVVIYRHRSRLVFPIDTPEEDYPKWQRKGFNIFRCVECNSMNCSGDCTAKVTEDAPVVEFTEEEAPVEFTEEEAPVVDLKGESEEISDEKELDYEELTLKELRVLFPEIKAVSKKDFIKKIEEI